jgi:hypothetical protein
MDFVNNNSDSDKKELKNRDICFYFIFMIKEPEHLKITVDLVPIHEN